MNILKNIYLTTYLIFYRLAEGLWPKSFDFDRSKATGLISLICYHYLVGPFNYITKYINVLQKIENINIYLLFFIIYTINFYLFIHKDIAKNFFSKFDQFNKQIRFRYYLMSSIFIIVSICFVFIYFLNP
jgi:hypothetical protein